MANKALRYLQNLRDQINLFIDHVNGAENTFNIDFENVLETYTQISISKPYMDLDEFCENEAFGYFISRNDDTKENRELFAKILKLYIVTESKKRVN